MLNKNLREYAKQNIEKIVLADLALTPELNPEVMSKEEQDKVFDDNIHFTTIRITIQCQFNIYGYRELTDKEIAEEN